MPPTPGQDRALTFPSRLDIKAMGKHDAHFEALIVDIVRRHVASEDVHAVRTRMSNANRYVAVTLTITASSYDQLDAIYQNLSDCAQVLFAL